jgi:DNA (cytosine-5)-methyltransferase 1
MPGLLSKQFGGGVDPKLSPISFGDPVHTLLQIPANSFIVENYGKSKAKGIHQPVGAQTTVGNYALYSHPTVSAFLTYYYGRSNPTGLEQAIGTMTTIDRAALVLLPMGNIDINDCTYRMLSPSEVQRTMAFEDDYIVLGNAKEKMRQLGNAVTPPAMELLIDRCVQTLL